MCSVSRRVKRARERLRTIRKFGQRVRCVWRNKELTPKGKDVKLITAWKHETLCSPLSSPFSQIIFSSYGAFRSPKAPSTYQMGQQLVLPLHNVCILENVLSVTSVTFIRYHHPFPESSKGCACGEMRN